MIFFYFRTLFYIFGTDEAKQFKFETKITYLINSDKQ